MRKQACENRTIHILHIIRNKQLRKKIPDLLLEKLSCPFTLLQQHVAEVLAEIGRAYPEQDVNDRLFALIENIKTDKNLLTRLNHPIRNEYLYCILADPEAEKLHHLAVNHLVKQNQSDQQKALRAMLQSKETSQALRLTIAEYLVSKYPQEIMPVLWEIYRCEREKPIRKATLFFVLEPLLLLLEQKDRKAIVCTMELLEDENCSSALSIISHDYGKRDVHLFIPHGHYYRVLGIAKRVIDLADLSTLNSLCINRRIHAFIRRDLIRQITQTGKQACIYISTLLSELTDHTSSDDTRIALAEALGEFITDEQITASLLELYQEEKSSQVKDALYTALYKIARRTNIAIVPDKGRPNELIIIRR